MWAEVRLNTLWILSDIFYTFLIRILQSAVEFWNNSSRKQMASDNEYFGPTMYRWGYHQRSKGIQARLKKNSFIQEFVPNYTLDAILAPENRAPPRFTRDPQNIVVRPPTFSLSEKFHACSPDNQFRNYESFSLEQVLQVLSVHVKNNLIDQKKKSGFVISVRVVWSGELTSLSRLNTEAGTT